jgi:predicted nucleic acid-binding protein
VVPIGEPEARLAAAWRRSFAADGFTLQRWDLLIAACAVTRGVALATANVRHFPMPELTVEHWPSE